VGRRRDPTKTLAQLPPTPPVELWDSASEEELSWDNIETETPPTDYSNELSLEEEEEGLAATEASLPTRETDEGIWFRSSSPFWRVREEWKRASYAQRADMDKYSLNMEVKEREKAMNQRNTEKEK